MTKIEALDWAALSAGLDERGFALTPPLLTQGECAGLIALYPQDAPFRKRIVMQSHGYGRGEYKYFAYPLPPLVAQLRAALYRPLARIANRWQKALGLAQRFPAAHAHYLKRCHAGGQTRPTPLMLRYAAGDYNRLHQDLYGEHIFPLQATILLSDPERDFTGGAFVLTEQRPRMQSRVEVVTLDRGQAVIFPVNHRPIEGKRGHSRAAMRHGVGTLDGGERLTLGVIFHDAR
jgi:hypothetical protein